MNLRMGKSGAFLRDRGGSAAIEFAIVGNVFLMFLFAIAYLAIFLWHAANLDWAVEAASRVAVVNSSATQSDIQTAVNNYLSSVGMGSATVQYNVTTSNGVKVAQITASKSESFAVPFFSTKNLNYQATADVPQP